MKQYKNIMAQLPGNAEDMGTCGGIQSTGFLFLSEKWVRGELTGEQMKQELLDLHRKIAAEENRSDY